MSNRIGLTIPSLSGLSIPAQEAAIGSSADIFVMLTAPNATKLTARCRRLGINLSAGDQITVADSTVFTRDTEALVKLIADLSRRGILIHFAVPGLTFDPADLTSQAQQTIALLDRQWRACARERQFIAAQAGSEPGRPRRLTPEEIERIPALMAAPGATSDSVARLLKISRATLYRYLNEQGSSLDE